MKYPEISLVELKYFSGSGDYDKIWSEYHFGKSRTSGFNFCAMTWGINWFFYRKMYAYGLLSLVIEIALIKILVEATEILFQSAWEFLDKPHRLAVILPVFCLWKILLGYSANILYYKRALKSILPLSDLNISNEAYLASLSAAGGVSISAVFAIQIFLFLMWNANHRF